jgi:hypothetical protein
MLPAKGRGRLRVHIGAVPFLTSSQCVRAEQHTDILFGTVGLAQERTKSCTITIPPQLAAWLTPRLQSPDLWSIEPLRQRHAAQSHCSRTGGRLKSAHARTTDKLGGTTYHYITVLQLTVPPRPRRRVSRKGPPLTAKAAAALGGFCVTRATSRYN